MHPFDFGATGQGHGEFGIGNIQGCSMFIPRVFASLLFAFWLTCVIYNKVHSFQYQDLWAMVNLHQQMMAWQDYQHRAFDGEQSTLIVYTSKRQRWHWIQHSLRWSQSSIPKQALDLNLHDNGKEDDTESLELRSIRMSSGETKRVEHDKDIFETILEVLCSHRSEEVYRIPFIVKYARPMVEEDRGMYKKLNPVYQWHGCQRAALISISISWYLYLQVDDWKIVDSEIGSDF